MGYLRKESAMTKVAQRGSTAKLLDFFNWSDSPWAGLTQLRLATAFKLEHFVEDGRFVVRAELPGLDLDKNIDVTVRDGILRIQAERQEERKNGQRSEFRYGALTRSVELPSRAEVDKITASYDKGILEVVVPLSEAERADQRIEITSAS
jgi:HSP20 family molecular chaperone IbpA